MKNLLVHFVDLISSRIEAMEESRPDPYESLKEQLQQVKAEINKPKRTDETSKGKFTKTRGTDCPCRTSH